MVAKLRAMKTDNNLLLMYINMSAGHGGQSGRFLSLKEEAMRQAFMLDLVGIKGIVYPNLYIEDRGLCAGLLFLG